MTYVLFLSWTYVYICVTLFRYACTDQSHKGPPELVLLTLQIHHLTAFSCDLLTNCWSLFSTQWPIAVLLVIGLLKSSGALDNTRELYVSLVSSPTKNGLLPLNNISACLQCGARADRAGVRVCVCVYVSSTHRRLWLWVHGILRMCVERWCGLRLCDRKYKSNECENPGTPVCAESFNKSHNNKLCYLSVKQPTS